jgi:hypothetical protein
MVKRSKEQADRVVELVNSLKDKNGRSMMSKTLADAIGRYMFWQARPTARLPLRQMRRFAAIALQRSRLKSKPHP